VLATVHPSAVLRATGDDRDEAFAGLVADLRTARDAVIQQER
jgi:uracil-DNA glycosylase